MYKGFLLLVPQSPCKGQGKTFRRLFFSWGSDLYHQIWRQVLVLSHLDLFTLVFLLANFLLFHGSKCQLHSCLCVSICTSVSSKEHNIPLFHMLVSFKSGRAFRVKGSRPGSDFQVGFLEMNAFGEFVQISLVFLLVKHTLKC